MKNPNRFLGLLIVCLVFLVSARPIYAGALFGSVVEVLDGATISVKVDNRVIKVRLCTVLVPKKDQALAEIAKFHLTSLLKGKQILVSYKGLSGDGSIDALVTLNDVDMGMQMVRDGAATYNRAYDNLIPEQTRRLYAESEQAARDEARGIWQSSARLTAEDFGAVVSQAASAPVSAKEEARRLNDEAYVLIQQGNRKAALPRCREAVRLDPSYAVAHKNLGMILFETGHPEAGLLEIQEAIRLRPDLDKAHQVLGNILLSTRNYEGAIRAYHEAIRLNPKYAKAYYNLSVALMDSGQFAKALVALRETDRLAPNQPGVLLNTGWILNQLGKRAEAREYWKRVLPLGDPVSTMLAEENLQSLH